MTPWGAGRSLIALVALITVISPTLVDFNDSHIFNPNWSAHAKFHVAHTMVLGVVLGVVALGYLYPARRSGLPALRAAGWFAAVFWIAQAGSILLPGTAFADPEFADQLPHVAGLTITQPVLDVVFVSIIVAGYILESRRLRAAAAHTPPRRHRSTVTPPRDSESPPAGTGDPLVATIETGQTSYQGGESALLSRLNTRLSGWWGYSPCAWSALFAALHFYWALGGEAGLASSAGTELAATRPLWFVLAGLWGVGLLLVAGAGLAVMLTRYPPPGPLNRLVTGAGWAIGLLLLLRGVGLEVLLLSDFYENNTTLTSSQVRWSLVLWNPWFIFGGVAFALASLTARDRQGTVPQS